MEGPLHAPKPTAVLLGTLRQVRQNAQGRLGPIHEKEAPRHHGAKKNGRINHAQA